MKKFLMCSPDGVFDCLYTINPWMVGNVHNIDKDTAIKQWKNLRSIVSEFALVETKIEFLDESIQIPDLVFTANAGLPFKMDGQKSVVVSSFLYEQRRKETSRTEVWFNTLGYTTFHVDSFFEGAGDALVDTNNRLWVGVGRRSADLVIDELRDLTKDYYTNINGLELINPRFYHLDTCFCPLSKGHIMWYPKAFSTQSYWHVAMLIGHRSSGVHDAQFRPDMLIDVDDEDALNFACNAICIDDIIILNKASANLKARLVGLGYMVIETDLTEFMKAGGSAKCLVLELLD